MTDLGLSKRREAAALFCGFAVLCAVAGGIVGRDLAVPGLYYDEVIQAGPAMDFLAEDGTPPRIPGARSARLLGRWFPVMTQPYMGALKSQALLPTFALFGASPASLRLTTLAWGLLGLLLAMHWARQVLGLPVALAAGALIALDPSFLFVSRHDWGSFALGLLCRCGGLLYLTSGWRRRTPGRMFAGGLLLGLGVYNKIDFAVFLVAAGLALALVAPGVFRAAARARLALSLPAALGFALGAAPMIAALGGALAATRAVSRGQVLEATGWSERLHTIATMLDGSYFHRLMLAGGSFEHLSGVEGAAAGPFLAVFVGSALLLAVRLGMDGRRGTWNRAHAFVLATAILALMGVLLMPRGGRIHHALNVLPFPHLVTAIAIERLWRGRSRTGRSAMALRAAAAAVILALLAGQLLVDLRTFSTIRETGGRGRWSDAVARFASELESRPGAVAVSLDWGFDGPLRFAAPGLERVEPIWRMRRARPPGRAWRFEGSPGHVYLLYGEEYAVFDYGAAFLDAVRRLPPESAAIRQHSDGGGDPAFLSVRFARPHSLVYDGKFEVRLR